MGYFAPSSSSSSSASSSPSTSSETLFVADLESGFSGCAAPSTLYPPPLPMAARRTIAPENLYRRSRGFLGARPAATAKLFFCDGSDDDEPRYFLDSCFRCKKSLSGNCDIYMYRGDTPFCSEECREEQIEIDEGRESDRKLRLKASSIKDRKTKSGGGAAVDTAAASNPPKSLSRYHLKATGTIVAS